MKGVQPINILQSINFENYSPQKLNQKARKLTWKKNNSSEIVTECTECTELALLWVQSLVDVSFDISIWIQPKPLILQEDEYTSFSCHHSGERNNDRFLFIVSGSKHLNSD